MPTDAGMGHTVRHGHHRCRIGGVLSLECHDGDVRSHTGRLRARTPDGLAHMLAAGRQLLSNDDLLGRRSFGEPVRVDPDAQLTNILAKSRRLEWVVRPQAYATSGVRPGATEVGLESSCHALMALVAMTPGPLACSSTLVVDNGAVYDRLPGLESKESVMKPLCGARRLALLTPRVMA